MEDLIDIRNRKENKNIVKWYNCNYEETKNVIGEEGNEMYLSPEGETEKKDAETSYAEDVLNRINQAREDKVLAAIMEGKEQ